MEVGSGPAGSKFLKSTYPVDEGLTAGTQKAPDEWTLEPDIDIVSEREKVGI